KDALEVLQELARVQEKIGRKQNDSAVISTYKRMGLCYAKLRQLDKSIEHLRDAVVRCQSSSDDVLNEMVDCLCLLSTVYRQKDRTDRSRTCIRQAYSIVADEPSTEELQIQVLEELAALTYSQKRPRSAAIAFIRVLQLKRSLYGPLYPGCADT